MQSKFLKAPGCLALASILGLVTPNVSSAVSTDYDSSSSWIVPTGVVSIDVTVWGGGGGGSGASGGGGNGGAGANTCIKTIPVAFGDTISWTIGAGGAGASGTATGGGTTTVSKNASPEAAADGGGGAGVAPGTSGATTPCDNLGGASQLGGNGGFNSGGFSRGAGGGGGSASATATGEDGANGTFGTGGAGGAGGSDGGATGGSGGGHGANGSGGDVPGAGGGGGGGLSSTTGGSGANGRVNLTYVQYVCGDGTVDPGEACDDSNLSNGDCCSSTCQFELEDSPCDDGAFCTTLDHCNAFGVCVPTFPNCIDGIVGDDDADCSESCDEDADACTANDSDSTPCNDDLFCTLTEECEDGECVASSYRCDGPDGDGDCTETCDEDADNCDAADTDGSSCDDGQFCTGAGETCTAGSCGGSTDPCDGPDGDADCSETCDETLNGCSGNDVDGSACDDGLFCFQDEECAAGVCSGTAVTCDDTEVCTDDACDEPNDECDNDPNTDPCDDGLFCTENDTCSGGSCAGTGDPCDGPDGDADCSESCDETLNNCNSNDANGSTCDDGLFCIENEECAAGACGGGAAVTCDDSEVCTDDTCDEPNDECDNDPNTAPCDDGLFCTETDACSGGSCAGAGDPCEGSDGDADCSESCDETANNCSSNDANGSACDDGLFCTGAGETCTAGSCGGGTAPCSGPDGDADCSESCDEMVNDCSSNDTDGSSCDDADACTAGDQCTGGSCTSGAAEDCDDGDLCTVDTCDSGSGCQNDGVPADPMTCFAAEKSQFSIKNSDTASKDSLKWSWKKGIETFATDLGSPASTTTYSLCVFDETGDVPTLVASYSVPPSATLWTEKLDKGQAKYNDKPGSADGVTSIKAKAGAAGKSGLQLKAMGTNLVLPTPGAMEYFDIDTALTVQMINSAGSCWSSEFSSANAKKNTTSAFTAAGP